MRELSLTARLATWFALITVLVFGVGGGVLYHAMAQQIRAQDDFDLVLTARHLRRLAEELDSPQGVVLHESRLDSLVLGNQAFFLRVQDESGHVLLDRNPSHIAIGDLKEVKPTNRILEHDVQEWHTPGGLTMRGVATDIALSDGSVVDAVVGREMSDREALLARYRNTLYLTTLSALLATLVLGYLAVRVSLRPLRDIAGSATHVTVGKLDTRIPSGGVPRELAALVSALNSMLARLELGFQRLSQFTADLAHDLRTPLGNMRGASEVALARSRSADEYQAVLISNIEECERLSRMVENVLFLARADNPQYMTTATRFPVRDELQRVAEYFEGIADDAGIAIQVAASGQLHADIDLFRRAVSNLLANALRYTPRGDTVTLTASETHDGVTVTVANPGTPIAQQHLSRLFDRFYRVDESRSNPSGSTGLGLAIVRTIMELHGGSASVESDTTATQFHLHFPLR
ncbi:MULTISPECIES: heavy metal sensor histidine kinase [Paraburkholderia]|uniref:heavy metal sensor histidine kinase n=1 Tax=Paraburkholderia TaxID=1822464 RepID=UPI00224D6CB9|nr:MULTISPECIES: heavy metal sensor histidine kinase [Paraburkholderia]MCX4164228.1 heavy metal sensor histidine kinase [Paraburkholderia megapolitana]MDN7159722.1 heavy metal sensor histidine kinase [Paraburkholderia sp. CHISQ3]MDQ6496769.1 heavy metal sensor histidine kinase [Paraburkholderia megapolitana]